MAVAVLMRWGGGLLASILVVAFVYRPHALRGETSSPAFPPQRIVSITLAADEILLALIPPERILGLTYLADDPQYSNIVEAARQVHYKVHSNAEQVIALQPDLIIASASAYTGATARSLIRETGIRLLELPWHDSFAGVQKNILAIGQTIGATRQAKELVADMDRRLQAVHDRVAGSPRPRVLYYFPGGFTAGSGTTMDEMISRAGGLNVALAAGIQGIKQLSQETLITLNPAVILVGGTPNESHEQDEPDAPADGSIRPFLMADPSLADIDAIHVGRVYVVPRPYVGSLSQYVVNGVEAMAALLHPHAFVRQDTVPAGTHEHLD